MNIKTRVALASLLCALGSQAMASSQASASITNLKFQLIDLNPMDGVAATMSFSVGSTTLSLAGNNYPLGDADSSSRTRAGYMSFARVYEFSLDNLTGYASIGDGSLSVSGSASGAGTSFSANAASYASQLQLSAQTLLIITADASATATALDAAACASSSYRCNASEQATATASMTLNYNYYTSTGSTSVSYSDSVYVSASSIGEQSVLPYYDWWYCHYYGSYCGGESVQYSQTEQSNTASRAFSAVFLNTSNTVQNAYFAVGANVSGSANGPTVDGLAPASITPVPEADTSAMAVIGAAVAGAVVTRRRRSA